MEAGAVIVVTGPPGAGKTTVSRIVAEALPMSAHLHCDDFFHYIRSGFIPPYLPESHHQNEVVNQAIADAATDYAAGGFTAVLDGIIGPWFVDVFRRAADTRSLQLHYIVLRPSEATAIARASDRGRTDLTDTGPVREMYRQFSSLGDFERFVLNNTAESPPGTAANVLRVIADGSHVLKSLGPTPST